MSGSIARQSASYRQGLVLGLTMAEIMLLLVFSLLIAIGVALATERIEREEVTQRLRGAEAAAAGASSSSAAHTRAGLGSSGPNSRRW